MVGENDIPPWTKKLLEIARRDGVRLDDPRERNEFMRLYAAEVAKQAAALDVANRLGGVEAWQMHELGQTFAQPLLERLIPLLGSPPDFALLFMLDNGDPRAGYATDHDVGIRATFEDGTTAGEGIVTKIVQMGGARIPRLARVEPLVPWGGFFLWICSSPHYTQQLLAWDIRPLLVSPPESTLRQLLRFAETTGVPNATRRRTAQLRRLHYAERRDLLRDAVASNTMEPGVRRMPLHGLMQTGHPVYRIDAAEGTIQPYRLLKFVDDLLEERLVVPYRQGQAVELDPDVLGSPSDDRAHGEDIDTARRLVEQHLTGKELAAVLLYMDAEYEGKTPEQYCKTLGHPYQAVKRAHTRAIARLREIVEKQR